MKKATAITCVFLDIGGVLLTNGSDHHARKRTTTNWDDEPSFGYVALRGAHVHVAAYDANGKLLAEKVDNIDANDLVRWHLRPRPRAPYAVFFPWKPSQIAKVTVGTE